MNSQIYCDFCKKNKLPNFNVMLIKSLKNYVHLTVKYFYLIKYTSKNIFDTILLFTVLKFVDIRYHFFYIMNAFF